MAISKSERAVIENVIRKLSDDKQEKSKLYLDSWIIPALKILIQDARRPEDRREDLRLAHDLSD